MARSVAWRRTLSDACCWHQAEAQNATIYILRETGPTGFLLKEEGETKNVKVFLGDPHSCTCPTFRKEKDLCKHISWLLLKKFRVPKENPVTWQLGLVEREINEILRGQLVPRPRQTTKPAKHTTDADGREVVKQRGIDKEDVCPICQEEFLGKHLPVTYCKFGCGNSVHMKCMKVWAEHQQGLGEKAIKCPMCREDFGPFNLLKMEMRNAADKKDAAARMDRHLGTCCRSCHLAPIEGKCYRCVHCTEYYLCQSCFNTPTHTQHHFEYRHKRNQRWRPAERIFGAAVPQAVAHDLMNRDLSASDYDILLQLDNQVQGPSSSNISEVEINQLPLERVRDRSQLLVPGAQCRVCLRGFETGQFVRKLPCRHKFHKDCIDNWLLHSHPTCPVDGLNILTASAEQQGGQLHQIEERQRPEATHLDQANLSGGITLEIPGIGIAALNNGSSSQQDVTMASRQHGARNHPLPHRPPANMELAGVGLASDVDRVSTYNLDTDSTLPGNRLLQRAMQHRNRLGHQLASIQTREVGEPVHTPPRPDLDLGDTLRTGSNSAPPVVEGRPPVGPSGQTREVNTSERGQRGRPRQRKGNTGAADGVSRRRSGSRERASSQERQLQSLMQNIQAFQDLYLGSNPRVNPPQGETTTTGTLRNPFRRGSLNSRKQKPAHSTGRAPRTVDIVMEGSHIDSLTLRDILR